jgi:hypothetical protein
MLARKPDSLKFYSFFCLLVAKPFKIFMPPIPVFTFVTSDTATHAFVESSISELTNICALYNHVYYHKLVHNNRVQYNKLCKTPDMFRCEVTPSSGETHTETSGLL